MLEPYLSQPAFQAKLAPLDTPARISLLKQYRTCAVCQHHVHKNRALFIEIRPDLAILSGPQANFAISLQTCDRCAAKLLDDSFKKLLDEALQSTDRENP